MVNALNYFVVLVTGLFDNVAWLAAIRHSLYSTYRAKPTQVVLNMPVQQSRVRKATSFQKDLQQQNGNLYNLIVNSQGLLDVFYPVRHSIQHRVVLSGLILAHADERWERVVVRFEKESIEALLLLEPARLMSFNSWGIFQAPDDDHSSNEYTVEPFQFSTKAVSLVFDLVNEALRLLDMPQLVSQDQALFDKVIQEPVALRRFLMN